ncbi:MAG: hypothetical protein M1828_004609 [Chrysothrix sp. TS-e1954]|nr:MAG: hypothetical protein M1828_004609 [Chrysothrix sp. TS-e1954]
MTTSRRGKYARRLSDDQDKPPSVDICYFYALSLDIDDELAPIKDTSPSETKLRPLSSADNVAVEKAWQNVRQLRRQSRSRRLSGGARAEEAIKTSEAREARQSSGVPNVPPSPKPSEVNTEGLSGRPFVRVTPRPDGYKRDAASVSAASRSQGFESVDAEDEIKPEAEPDSSPSINVAVGVSKLHHVSVPRLELSPIYWRPVSDTSSICRGTWFYKVSMLPLDPDVANLLETGFLALRPWTETWKAELQSAIKVGAAGEEKIVHPLWPPHASPKAQSRPGTSTSARSSHRGKNPVETQVADSLHSAAKRIEIAEGLYSFDNCAVGFKDTDMREPDRKYYSSAIMYVDSAEAVILRPSLQPSSYFGRRPLANYIYKGRKIGITVTRGFRREEWDSLHPVIGASRTREEKQPTRKGANKDDDDKVSQVQEPQDANPSVTDLVLVVHGIGQKLSESVESYHFTRVVNALRRNMNAEVVANKSSSYSRSNRSRIMALPVNWRSQISFEGSQPVKQSDETQTNPFTLDDITPRALSSVRSIIGDVMLDIPLYLSSHRPKMIQAVTDEANRIYRLWCNHNPRFPDLGRVHILAHSLGSLMVLDILSKQPTTVDPGLDPLTAREHFKFNTSNLVLCGSPAGVFLLLEKTSLLPRHDCRKVEFQNQGHSSEATGSCGTPGCLAVDNIYNVINPYDCVAYRLNAAVDRVWAAALKPAYLPSASASWLSIFGATASSTEPSGNAKPGFLRRLPSTVEMETHNFTQEELAEQRAVLLNDNGQIDYLLKYSGGPLGWQYLTMLGAHSSYWTSEDFVRFIVAETLRPPGQEGTLPPMRASKKKPDEADIESSQGLKAATTSLKRTYSSPDTLERPRKKLKSSDIAEILPSSPNAAQRNGTRKSARQIGIPAAALGSPPPSDPVTTQSESLNYFSGAQDDAAFAQSQTKQETSISSDDSVLDNAGGGDTGQGSGSPFESPMQDLEDTMLQVLDASSRNLLEFFRKCSTEELLQLSEDDSSVMRKVFTGRLSPFNHIKAIYKQEGHFFGVAERGDPTTRRSRILCAANLVTAVASLLIRDVVAVDQTVERFDDIFHDIVSGSSAQTSRMVLARLHLQAIALKSSQNQGAAHRLQHIIEHFVQQYGDTAVAKDVRAVFPDTSKVDSTTLETQFPWQSFVRLMQGQLQHSLDCCISEGLLEGSRSNQTFDGDEITGNVEEDDDDDFEARVRLAAQAAMRESVSDEDHNTAPVPQDRYHPFRNEFHPANAQQAKRGRPRQPPEQADVDIDGADSIRERYRKARLAASARVPAQRSAPPQKRDRRLWTKEEEKALMHGLDRCQGGHWSQILLMYGLGGTVSEVLKDRTQIQLKDKARNLKLFFLKTDNEVPTYLKPVTGELKTRAPVRARKKEAKQQLQNSSAMDRITEDALAALAGASRPAANLGDESSTMNGRQDEMRKQHDLQKAVHREATATEKQAWGAPETMAEPDEVTAAMHLVEQSLEAGKQLD